MKSVDGTVAIAGMAEGAPPPGTSAEPIPARPSKYAIYVLALLFVISVFSYIDRNMVLVLQVQIKEDLQLNDSEMGLLTGASFALLYTSFALPLAWWSDRTVRSRLLTGALFVWSAMTGLSGYAANFVMLLLLRMGVAIGEAGCVPSSVSLMADYFPRRQRGTAMAFWALALPLGTMLGLGIGGRMAQAFGWRETFIIVGAVGMLLAPLVWLTLREPLRGRYDSAKMAQTPQVPLRASFAAVWRIRSYRYIVIAIGLHCFVYYAFMSWSAPFYVRLHGMSLGDTAVRLGLYTGVGGMVGTFLGGVIADWRGRDDARWYTWVPMIAMLTLPGFAIAQFLVGSTATSWMLAMVPSLLVNVYIAPLNAVSQSLMAPRMRGFAMSILMLSSSIVGMGLGPLLVGMLSDLLEPRLGVESLRYAVIVPMSLDFLAAGSLWIASRHIRAELATSAGAQV